MYQRSYEIFFLLGLIAGGKSTRENYCASVAHVCNVQCSILNTECLFIFILPLPALPSNVNDIETEAQMFRYRCLLSEQKQNVLI